MIFWGPDTFRNLMEGFPSGSVVRNLPANAGDAGLIPWFRKIPRASEQLSPWATTIESELQNSGATTAEPMCPRVCAPQQEKPLQWEASALQLESSPHSLQLEKSLHCNEDPA